MKARLAVAGSVMAGLVAVGGVAVASTWQPAQPPARQSVEFVQPAADTSTPTDTATATDTATPTETATATETATVAPVVVPTTDPVAAPAVVAPAPVESTTAPAPVATSAPEVIVPKVVQPAPVVSPTYRDGTKAEVGKYPDGTPVRYAADGVTIILFPASCANSDGTISTPDWSSGAPVCANQH